MKAKQKNHRLLALFILSALLGLSMLLEGCSDRCTETYSYTYYEPVYTKLSVIRSSIKQETPRPLVTVGKIYFKDGYLFVNQPGEGIHIIDNRNTEAPLVKSFIAIPGNYDLAIRNNILYADSYIDLVALDISDLNQVQVVNRLENIFSNYNSMGFHASAELGVVTDWIEKEVTWEETECEMNFNPWGGTRWRGGLVFADAANFSAAAAIAPGNSTGIGGSMARFTINEDFLYMLDGGNVHSVDITIASAPEKKSSQYVMWDIETIFPYGDKLFIGARSGMHILDLAVPENPEKIATYAHVNSCDPVVVSGNYAYVTLRSGTQCTGFTNQLEVLNISTITSPKLEKVYPMHNPHGLGIDEPVLFICDGDAGLKIYNATDKLNIDKHLIKHYKDIHAYDVIPFNNVLMLIGENGILQYDYSDLNNIRLLSRIQVTK
ncbi:MAG: hypothetical protein KF687_09735 [Cyclobacteriaceae bacterium]|nr:hypothetical protein [Cyclobacteriaceae bacterium]